MRVLLDECLPRQLGNFLAGHDVQTVPEAGWAGKQNGELLELAAGEFDVLLTIDQGVSFQQDLARFRIAVLGVKARTNRLADLLPLVPRILEELTRVRIGEFRSVEADR